MILVGHDFGEVTCRPVVINAELASWHRMDGDDRLGLEGLDGLYNGAGFRFTDRAGAAVVSMSGARFSPIAGGEVSIAIDAIDILTSTSGQAVRVGDWEDGYGGALPYPRVVVEKAEQTSGQLGGGGLVPVDAAEDEDGIGARTEDGHNQRLALDGVAKSNRANGGAVAWAFLGSWCDNFYGVWNRLMCLETASQSDGRGEQEQQYQA